MTRELQGPILEVYMFSDAEWDQTLNLIDTSSRYGLTGSIFAKDPYANRQAQSVLKHVAGMSYLNTRYTGSTTQQPLMGGRDSSTKTRQGLWPIYKASSAHEQSRSTCFA